MFFFRIKPIISWLFNLILYFYLKLTFIMNRKLYIPFLIACCMMAFGCIAPEKKKVSVRGDIDNLGFSTLYISYFNKDKILAYDTVYSSRSGKFEFKVDSYDKITPVTIYFAQKKCWTTLFAEPGDRIAIKGNIQMVDLLYISGGVVNNDLNRFKKQIQKLYMTRQAILNGKYPTSDEKEQHLAEINLLLKRSAKEFIKDNPDAIASVVLIQDFFYQEYDPITKDLLNLLEGEAQESHLTQRIREGIKEW